MILNRSKVLSEHELRQLLEALSIKETTDFRNTTFIQMLLHTGARVSEVLGIRVCDLYDEGMVVFIHGTKGSNDRELPLTPYLFNRMKVLIKGLEPLRRIFNFKYSNARTIWLEYRPNKKKIHSLRHTRALQIYKKTKDPLIVKRVLGHKSLGTTMIYLDFAQSPEEIQRALM